jgi:fumarate hydratase, class II
VTDIRVESDSLGRVEVPADKLWGAAHRAHGEDLSLKEAALRSGYVDEKQFDEIVDPRKMVGRPVAAN